MAMTKRLGAYADIKAAFLAAIEHSGGTLTFNTTGAARNWRQRAYYYRQLLGSTHPEFDCLHLKHVNFSVEITLTKLDAKFTTPEGEAVIIELESDQSHDFDPDVNADPLLTEAMNLVRTGKEA